MDWAELCGCVLPGCLLPELMLLLLSSSVAEGECLRNDLLLGRSRLTEMMMGWERWAVADGARLDGGVFMCSAV